MSNVLLKIQDLCFSFGEHKVIDNLSLTLESNEIVSLIGWSGAGKTTLFKILTGIYTPTKGTLNFSGHLGKSITYMTQEDLLLPWRTVLGNLLLLAELGQVQDLSKIREEARLLLKEMGLENCADLYPDQLSGGMRQRVSLSRALLQKRPLLLLDEPFGGLDVVLREQIYQLLRKIKQELKCTILMITHDFRDALCLSDRIVMLHAGSVYKSWCMDPTIRKDPTAHVALTEEIRNTLFDLKNHPVH
ncbi:MAG: hypothetical protein BGO14_06545 [Chlamydiales bacterium 38-26]|nr:ABC transporter ATP-binding protein [Chlamydiales bacterium]OJV08538.1 MAG: hypothetical protein BGO14_06545 [Chlamydiales bacterium 38-26]